MPRAKPESPPARSVAPAKPKPKPKATAPARAKPQALDARRARERLDERAQKLAEARREQRRREEEARKKEEELRSQAIERARAERREQARTAQRKTERDEQRKQERRGRDRQEERPREQERPKRAQQTREEPKPKPPTPDEFLELGLGGPPAATEAPAVIRLPDLVFSAMQRSLDAALADGREHGAIFGATGGARRYVSLVYADGDVHQIDYSAARAAWPALKEAGTYHTHLWELIDVGTSELRWAGGGHSDQDLRNLIVAERHMSAVIAQTRSGGSRIFLLVRPVTFTLLGGTAKLAADYRKRVLALVANGVDPVEASEQELVRVSRTGVVVLYTGEGPLLERR